MSFTEKINITEMILNKERELRKWKKDIRALVERNIEIGNLTDDEAVDLIIELQDIRLVEE